MFADAFTQVTVALAVAAVVSAIGLKLRQPLIISFLLAGVIAGPSVTGLVSGELEQFELLSYIGIALLLFLVGLRLDVGMIRTVGPVALATGMGQVIFTSTIGFAIAMAFRLPLITSIYVAVALTFSSTIIIVKLLSDKKEIDSLHGRIAVGFLIVQDIVAILALIALSALGAGDENRPLLTDALRIAGSGIAFLVVIVVLTRWVLPHVVAYAARSQEMLVLFAITWAVALSAAGEVLGFSREVGAFVAGVSLASTEQREAIGARLVVLRDFLLLFFFLMLGSQLDVTSLRAELLMTVVFSLFVLIGNPIIVMLIMGRMGYRKRTGFMSGLAVAQISEFSLILAALGYALGHIDDAALSLITLVGLVTICGSTYMILYSGPLYQRLSPLLSIFERRGAFREAQADVPDSDQQARCIVLIGLGNYGGSIAANLLRHGRTVLAVDFDPDAIGRARQLGLGAVYGDISDPEMLAALPLSQADWVVSTLRDRDLNRTLMSLLREQHFSGRVALTAADAQDAEVYRQLGAQMVLQPFRDASEQAVDMLTGAMQALPGLADWPVYPQEVVLRPGSVFAGKTIRQIPLRQDLGVSVLAVSRAGKVTFTPEPDFRLYPGDRVVLLGEADNVRQAVEYLLQREIGQHAAGASAFEVAQIEVAAQSDWAGSTLAEQDFRNRYGVTVIGILRDGQRLASPGPRETILANDRLIVVGPPDSIDRLHTRPEAATDGP